MMRIIVLALMMNILFMNMVFAENPAAEKYRAMIRSGNYHIVYQQEYGKKMGIMMEFVPAEEKSPAKYTEIDAANGQTMIWMNRKTETSAYGAVKERYSDELNYAAALYRDGKYYSFENNKKAYVITEEDYKEYRKNAMNNLANTLSEMRKQDFNWDKAMREAKINAPDKIYRALNPLLLLTDPTPIEKINELNAKILGGDDVDMKEYGDPRRINMVYQGSSTETIDGVAYDVDTYAEKGMEGSSGAGLGGLEFKEVTYYSRIYYKGGNIYKIEDDFMGMEIVFKEFSNNVPADRLHVPQGCKVYRAGLGDLDSLTGKEVLVEEY